VIARALAIACLILALIAGAQSYRLAREMGLHAQTIAEHATARANAIQAAREQWEHDTDSYVFTQTVSVTLERFCGREISFSGRPIQSITHLKYYDADNVLQTFSSASYSLNKPERKIVLNWNVSWPNTYDRWDAITVTYVAGYATVATVPQIAKQAMLLSITYNHFGNRGDNDRQNDQRAYESLVRRYMRSTYP